MLRIQPITSYTIARYPKGAYYESTKYRLRKLLITNIITVLMLLVFTTTSCKQANDIKDDTEKEVKNIVGDDVPGTGVVGPPPMPPPMPTEKEIELMIEQAREEEKMGRQIISQVFAENGIALEVDVTIDYESVNDNKIYSLTLDGYNKELKIGYEYPVRNEYSQVDDDTRKFTGTIINEIQVNNRPRWNYEEQKIEVKEPIIFIPKGPIDPSKKEEGIRRRTQEFISELRRSGILNTSIEDNNRQIINRIFEKNGVIFETDVLIDYHCDSDNKTYPLELDGYNRQLNIGYEYFFRNRQGEWIDDNGKFFLTEAINSIERQSRLALEKRSNSKETKETIIFIVAQRDESAPPSEKEIEEATEYYIRKIKESGIF